MSIEKKEKKEKKEKGLELDLDLESCCTLAESLARVESEL
jgi:hypothetical protein